ncbi:MAG: TRAP transporter large permease [Chloroflexi bacterium]|nr:TRAP transporter large permease [Chloroflexota bacterium]
MFGVLIAFGLFFFLLAIGTPIFVGVFVGAALGLYLVRGWDAVWGFFTHSLHADLAQYFFAIIPMFILVGMLSESGGLGQRAYETFHKLIGHIRGGLLVATTFAAAAFGACSGSTIASAALFSKVALPELKKHNYNQGMSLASIATAGTLATLIPPSAMMVIFGVLTNTSIGRLLIAGILPGLIVAAMLGTQILVMVRLKPDLAPVRLEPVSWRERLMAPVLIWPLLGVFAIIVGSIWTGLVAPSEAGALGSVVVLLWNFIARVPGKRIIGAFRDTAITSSQIMILILGGLILSKVVAYSRVTITAIDWIQVNDLPLAAVWGLIILIWLVLGMIIDSTSQLVLTLPFAFPIMTGLGVDPIVLGIVAIVMIELGVITPPVGFNCYVVASIAEVDPWVVFRGIFPFCVTLSAAVVLFILVPQISTFLPSLAFGG